MRSLEDFQGAVAKILLMLTLVHVAILTAVAAAFGQSTLVTFSATVLLAAFPIAWHLTGKPAEHVAHALVPTLVGQTAVLVWLFAGHPWQIEMHFYFFAILAMLAGFCSMPVLFAAAAAIAGHHLVLNWALPSLLYPGGTNTGRVLVHAWFVIVETAMLIVIGAAIRTAFERAQRSEMSTLSALDDLETARGDLVTALAASDGDVDRLDKRLLLLRERIGGRLDELLAASRSLAGNARDLTGTAVAVSDQTAKTIASAIDSNALIEDVAGAGQTFADIFAEIAAQTAGSASLSEIAVAQVLATKRSIEDLAGM